MARAPLQFQQVWEPEYRLIRIKFGFSYDSQGMLSMIVARIEDSSQMPFFADETPGDVSRSIDAGIEGEAPPDSGEAPPELPVSSKPSAPAAPDSPGGDAGAPTANLFMLLQNGAGETVQLNLLTPRNTIVRGSLEARTIGAVPGQCDDGGIWCDLVYGPLAYHQFKGFCLTYKTLLTETPQPSETKE